MYIEYLVLLRFVYALGCLIENGYNEIEFEENRSLGLTKLTKYDTLVSII